MSESMEVMQLRTALDIMNAEAERLQEQLELSRKQAAEFSQQAFELRNDLTAVECMLGRNVREKGEALDKIESLEIEMDLRVDVFAAEMTQMCRDYSSLSGNVYIKGVEATIDIIACRLKETPSHGDS